MKKLMIASLICMLATYVIAECISPPDVTGVPFAYDPNDAPERVVGWREATVLSELCFTVPTCDPDGDPVFVIPTYMPLGMTFDPNTNQCRWTPQASQIGVNWVAFEAIDEPPPGTPSLSDYAAMVINVEPRENAAPVLLPFGDCAD